MKWRVPGKEVDQTGLKEVVEKDCQAHKLNRGNGDAMEYGL